MAERRMLSISFLNSDAFLKLPPLTRLLYVYLNAHADDDGFVNRPRTVTQMSGTSEEDLRRLLEEGYLLDFGGDVMLVTHWHRHNKLREGRRVPTLYQELLSGLTVLPNGAYARLPDPPGGPPSLS